jgi:hypothetical protein
MEMPTFVFPPKSEDKDEDAEVVEEERIKLPEPE